MQTQEQIQNWYRSNFELFEKSLNGEARSPLHEVRKQALQRFTELGFPTTRNEEWKYTNVAPIAKTPFRPVLVSPRGVSKNDVERFSFTGFEGHRLVFVDGHFVQSLSTLLPLPEGVVLGSLAAAIRTNNEAVNAHLARYAPFIDNAFTSLNTAFMRDGATVIIPDGIELGKPIHLLFIATGNEDAAAIHPRNLIVVGKRGNVQLVEHYVALSHATYFTNTVTEVLLGEEAVVEHEKLQLEGDHAYHIASTHVHQQGGSRYLSNSVALGGLIVRNNITAVLDAEGIDCTLNGLTLATAQQLIDNHTAIDHAKPNCSSHELYKTILDGKAHGVFNGKIFVRKDAQKTDAKQTNKTLLLSDHAHIDTKPQLEIFADDVKCTHGATVGQIDAEALFYLRSRGIDEEMAKDLLAYAFASDVINRIQIEPLRAMLDNLLHERLQQGRIKVA
jgi:Fe-S cluster assembly protein SufD